MPEPPFEKVLDRKQSAAFAQQYLAKQLNLLEQLANYGSTLLVRVLTTKNDPGLGDVVVCSVLLRQVVAMIDSVHVALIAGSSHLAYIAARSSFEASLYLEWMLVSDQDKKAKYYYVGNIRRQRMWALRAIEDTLQHKNFALTLAQIGPDLALTTPVIAAEAKALLEDFNRVCEQDAFKAINKIFEIAYSKRNVEVEWYKHLGVASIRGIAKTLQRLPEYDMYYSRGSEIAHTSNIDAHVTLHKDRVHIKPIRNLDGVQNVLLFTVGSAIRTYKTILRNYRPSELSQFAKIYAAEWREAYLSIPKVNTTYSA